LTRRKIDNFIARHQDYVVTDSLSANLAKWAIQKEQRLGMGDVLAKPRSIDHAAFFRHRRDFVQACRDLEAIGFTTAVESKRFQNSISATRDEALDDENVINFLSVVIKIVESNRGIYDGFGGDVVN